MTRPSGFSARRSSAATDSSAWSPERVAQAKANFIDAELLGSGFAPLDEDDVCAVDIPTLLVTGDRSPRIFHRFIDRLEELLPRTERVRIPAASHIVHEDNPEAFEAAVMGFLGA
jgi:pimeloyl-ACP methyl ester carboxylesterase